MTYTQDEIRASLRKLLPATIRFPANPISGVRDQASTFSDMQAGAAYIFLNEPKAVHYVRYLGAKRARETAEAYLEAVQDLVQDIRSLRRPEMRATLTATNLADAATGLTQMETALQSGTFTSIDELPAYTRVHRDIDRYLHTARPSVTYGGNIARSKPELRQHIPSKVTEFRTTHATLVESLRSLVTDDYSSKDVFKLIAGRAVKNSRKLVTQIAVNTAASDKAEAEEAARQNALDLLAVKGVLGQLAQLEASSQVVAFAGTGAPFTDVDHLATPAQLTSQAGPFDLREASNLLTVDVDVEPAVTLTLPCAADVLRITGTAAEPYVFRAASTKAELATKTITTFTVAGSAKSVQFVFTYPSGGTFETSYVSVSFAIGVYAPADAASVIQAGLVAAGIDSLFEADSDATRAYVRALTAGSDHQIMVQLTYPMTEYLGWASGQTAQGLDKNNVLSLQTKAFSEYITIPAGTWMAEDLATYIESIHSPLLLLEADFQAVSYATPPFRVIVLKSTDSAADADIQVLATYNDGVSDKPALAAETLGLIQAVVRSSSRMSATALHPILDVLAGADVSLTSTGLLRITSDNQTLQSSLALSGTACLALFGAAALSSKGTTPWFLLSDEAKVAAGDTLIIHVGATATTYTIDSVYSTLLHLTPELPVDHATVDFEATTGTWGEFQSTSWTADDVFRSAAGTWLDTWEDSASYFSDLSRLLNMVLADRVPPAFEVNDAAAKLEELETALGDLITTIDAFEPDPVESVDLLLRSWKALGGDRMIDTLLGCKFKSFFGATAQQVSYSSNLSESMRAIARNELSISREAREYEDPPRGLVTIPEDSGQTIPLGPEDMYL